MPTFANVLKGYIPGLFGQRAPLARKEQQESARLESPAPLGHTDFLALDISPRASVLDPILPEKGLAMLYAPRGIGKSWLALSIGLAVAGGSSLLRWESARTAPRSSGRR
jgi:AAA domain